ncbi:hypothetical protein MKX01_019686 [Papaver californicum]|nr:hypothetical protein MKX01_019686 [Papaver californicum]
MIKDLQDNSQVIVTYKRAFSGCKRQIELIRGSPDQSYQHMVGYSHVLEKRNPGTVTSNKTDGNDVLMYYCMALGNRIRCRWYNSYKRTHMTPTAYDANEQLYPIASDVVDLENTKSCTWFMQKLAVVFGDTFSRQKDLVIGSDRSDKIRKGIEKAFSDAVHVYCAYHIKGNIGKKFHNFAAALAFMRAAQAYTLSEYEEAMKDLEKLSQKAAHYVRDAGVFNLMTTNVCEGWNAKIIGSQRSTHLSISRFYSESAHGMVLHS